MKFFKVETSTSTRKNFFFRVDVSTLKNFYLENFLIILISGMVFLSVKFSTQFLGSRMILVQLATDKEGQYTGASKSTPVSVHHKLIELWKRLLTDGLITQVRVIIVPGV